MPKYNHKTGVTESSGKTPELAVPRGFQTLTGFAQLHNISLSTVRRFLDDVDDPLPSYRHYDGERDRVFIPIVEGGMYLRRRFERIEQERKKLLDPRVALRERMNRTFDSIIKMAARAREGNWMAFSLALEEAVRVGRQEMEEHIHYAYSKAGDTKVREEDH